MRVDLEVYRERGGYKERRVYRASQIGRIKVKAKRVDIEKSGK